MTRSTVMRSSSELRAALHAQRALVERPDRKPLSVMARLAAARALHVASRLTGRPIKVRTRTFWNESIELVFPEVVSECIFRAGFYEAGLTTMLIEHVVPGMCSSTSAPIRLLLVAGVDDRRPRRTGSCVRADAEHVPHPAGERGGLFERVAGQSGAVFRSDHASVQRLRSSVLRLQLAFSTQVARGRAQPGGHQGPYRRRDDR